MRRVSLAVIASASFTALTGCGLVNAATDGAISSPFAFSPDDQPIGPGVAVLEPAPQATDVFEFQTVTASTESEGISFDIALPTGYASGRRMIVIVGGFGCLDAITADAFSQGIAIVRVVFNDANALSVVWAGLQDDESVLADDNKTNVVVEGDVAAIRGGRLGDQSFQGLLLLSPSGSLEVAEAERHPSTTTMFASAGGVDEAEASALQLELGWDLQTFTTTDTGCALVASDAPSAGGDGSALSRTRDYLGID